MIVACETVNGFSGSSMAHVDLLRFIPFRLNRLAAEVSRDLARVYSDQFGLEIAEWRVLATLGMSEPRSAQFIVRCTRTHKSKISRAVTRLALAGLIEGTANSEDRRETQLRMTSKGRALYERLVPIVLGYEQRLLASLETDELSGLSAGLDKLEQALGLVRRPDEMCLGGGSRLLVQLSRGGSSHHDSAATCGHTPPFRGGCARAGPG